MSTDRPTVTREQAREQLSGLSTRPLSSPRDRRIHGVGTAAVGLTLALSMATQNVVTGAERVVFSLVALCVLLGGTAWVERAARTVPRRARLWSRLGIGGSFVVALGAVLPWLNLQAQTHPNTWPMIAGAAVLVAAPSLAAAAVIARGRA